MPEKVMFNFKEAAENAVEQAAQNLEKAVEQAAQNLARPMYLLVSLDNDGTLAISIDGVERGNLKETLQTVVYTALSTRRKVKQDNK